MLFVTQKYYLLVFKTKESLAIAHNEAAYQGRVIDMGSFGGEPPPRHVAAHWSKRLREEVGIIYPGVPFLALSTTEVCTYGRFTDKIPCMHVLYGEKAGWIRVYDWMEIESFENTTG